MSNPAHTPSGGQRPSNGVADRQMTRGQFLTAATVGVGGVMGALIAAPVAGMALGPVFGGEDFETAILGAADEFKSGEFTKVVLTPNGDKPDAYVRKRVAFVRRNDEPGDDELALPDSDAKRLGVDPQWEFTVVSNICMHLGCPVQASNAGFVCPCHGGAYSKDGARTAGPPVRPLDRFLWKREGDDLVAVGIYALQKDGGHATHRDAGQHTSGPEKLFYPVQP